MTASPLALLCAVSCLFTSALAAPATDEVPPADPAPPAPSQTTDPLDPGPLSIGAAVIPGVLVHGAGTYVAGDKAGGKALLYAEGIGLGLILIGGGGLAITGASRRLAGPLTYTTGAGAGLFLGSWVVDLYGAATGGREVAPGRALPSYQLAAGWRYVYDPQFEYRHFAHLDGQWRLGATAFDATLWQAVDDGNQRISGGVSHRLLGDIKDRQRGDHLTVRGGAIWHDYDTEGFSTLSLEGALSGRLDLDAIGDAFRGAFIDASGGWALEFYDYDLPGVSLGEDTFDLLLMRVGLGAYLGGGPYGGEISVYYDHRRDDLAGGYSADGIGVGFLGSLGLAGVIPINDHWAIDLDAQYGSAVILGAGLRYRGGVAQ